MNHRELRRLADLLREYGLSEIEIEREGERVRLRRDPPSGVPALVGPAIGPAPILTGAVGVPAVAPPRADPSSNFLAVEAPMVGTFYRAPAPDSAPYVREGDPVKKGQVVCVIEAMKLMNEIEAKVAGRVVKVLVENAQPVEFGQPLFLLEP